SKQDALLILDTAEELARVADRPIKKLPTLRGRTVVNLFFEDSTRTRISFEAAAKRLSADVINFAVKGSSVAKGESLKATAVTLVAPPTLLPIAIDDWPCSVSYDLDAALPKSDVVMMLRIQQERMNAAYFPSVREYSRRYGLDTARLRQLPEDAIVMHPGPMNRGVEIAAEVADSHRSTIVEQVANGVSVRMAVLYLL